MNTNEESEAARAERTHEAEVKKQLSKINVSYQRLYGFLGGFVLGFIPPIALFFALAIRDQKYSKPGDIDLANPYEIMFLTFSLFLSPIISAVLGAIFCPLLISAIGKTMKKLQK